MGYNDNAWYICKICKKTFPNKKLLRTHRQIHLKGNKDLIESEESLSSSTSRISTISIPQSIPGSIVPANITQTSSPRVHITEFSAAAQSGEVPLRFKIRKKTNNIGLNHTKQLVFLAETDGVDKTGQTRELKVPKIKICKHSKRSYVSSISSTSTNSGELTATVISKSSLTVSVGKVAYTDPAIPIPSPVSQVRTRSSHKIILSLAKMRDTSTYLSTPYPPETKDSICLAKREATATTSVSSKTNVTNKVTGDRIPEDSFSAKISSVSYSERDS